MSATNEKTSDIDKSRFMVVAPPRGGFTLLLSILNVLYRDKGIAKPTSQNMVNQFIPSTADYVDAVMTNYFAKHIDLDDLFYNKEFKILVGGPKWMEDDDETVCVRKYLGVRDKGDFTFIQYVPKFAMDFDDVIHSHDHPQRWIEDPYYSQYKKFTSIRNPIDIIHSSVYSINALTSEYIQRCVDEEEHKVRLELAMNKLSNLEFVRGLILFLKRYLDEFTPVKDKFLYMMRWEDLIENPLPTITAVGEAAGIEMSAEYAGRIWKEIEHRNLTRYHKHSFRKGVMHDWKNSLTNSHLELFREHGFDDYLEEFGYPKIEFFDETKYTHVQKTIEECIKKGEPYEYLGDDNLYIFAFNKTNFLATGKYKFKTYPKKGGIKIEKSMFRDEPLILGFIDAMGPALSLVKDFLVEIKASSKEFVDTGADTFDAIKGKYMPLFEKEMSQEELATLNSVFSHATEVEKAQNAPILVETCKGYNIVRIGRLFHAVPQSLGPIDFTTQKTTDFRGIITKSTQDEARSAIDSKR